MDFFDFGFCFAEFILRSRGVVYNEIKRKQVQIVEKGRPWNDKAGKGFLH